MDCCSVKPEGFSGVDCGYADSGPGLRVAAKPPLHESRKVVAGLRHSRLVRPRARCVLRPHLQGHGGRPPLARAR
eukprot:11722667-Alexandrium_andersonii.AAC.1